MPSLLLKDVPTNLHQWLKREAARNRRSMTQQAIVILEEQMAPLRPVRFPPPFPLKRPVTDEFIQQAKKEGRA